MSNPPSYNRFNMLRAAWLAAHELCNDKGEWRENVAQIEERFMRRKACLGIDKSDCQQAFHSALKIAQATTLFRRTRCGMTSPKPSKRYELLLALANELEASFPKADVYFIHAACGSIESHWDR